MRHTGFYLCIIFLSLCKTPCFASYITIDTNTAVTIDDGQITIACKITNKGDEAAHQVEVQTNLNLQKFSSRPFQTLTPGKSLQTKFKFTPKTKFSRLIIPLVIKYKDSNLFGFSAVSYADAKSSAHELSTVYCRVKEATLSKKGRVSLTLKSLDHHSHSTMVRVITPHELTATPAEKNVIVPAESEIQANFRIANFSALAPSNYTILCIVSEKRNNGWYEEVFNGRINIVSPQKSLQLFSSPYIPWIIILLVIFFAIRQFKTKKN